MTHPGLLEAILFDKDGTLFDFSKTWNAWSVALLDELSQGDEAKAQRLANAIRFDLTTSTFYRDSPVIAGPNHEVASALLPELPTMEHNELADFLAQRAMAAPLSEAVPLVPYLAGLTARGLTLGVMTNDHEMSARSHLRTVGVHDMFDLIVGADSGYGAKPDPDPLLAFCEQTKVLPQHTVMVGDSTHDLIAGRAAGMRTLGVLTGMAEHATLAPYADAVLPDIGHIPDWLDGRVVR